MQPTYRRRRRRFVTAVVDVSTGQILDVFEGRDAADLGRWMATMPPGWLAGIDVVSVDPHEGYRVTSNTAEATATSGAAASRIELLDGILGPLVTLTIASPTATVTIAADGSTATADFTNPVITITTNPLTPTIINDVVEGILAGLPDVLADALRPVVTALVTPTLAGINTALDALPDQVQAGEPIDVDIIPGVLGLRLNIASGSATADGVVPAAAHSGVIDLGVRLGGQEVISLVGGRATAAGVPAGCTTLIPPVSVTSTTPTPTTPTTSGPGATPTSPPPPGAATPPVRTALPRTGEDGPRRTGTALIAALLGAGALVLTRRARTPS